MFELRLNLIVELVSWSASAISNWTPALNHKVINHPMKRKAVIISSFSQINKIGNGYRGFFVK